MQQAALYRRERQVVVSVVLGFVCDNLRDQRETFEVFYCADCLSPLACYPLADGADHADVCILKVVYYLRGLL